MRKQQVKAENFSAPGAFTTSYDEGAVSPLVGVVVRPLQDVALCANFTSGLSRGGTAPATAANAGEVFEPYKSEQYEAGLKLDRYGLISTLSVFQIDRPNVLTNPVTNMYRFDGKQRNRGNCPRPASCCRAENTLTLPSPTRVDVGGRYTTAVGGTPVMLRASVENVP